MCCTALTAKKMNKKVVPFPLIAICLKTIYEETHGAKTKKSAFSLSAKLVSERANIDPVLHEGLESLKAFYRNSLHLARPSKSHVVTAETHEGYVKALRELWGYQEKFHPHAIQCDLFAVMNGPLLLRYISFREVQQGNAAVTLRRMVAQLKAVMKWCAIVGLKDASVDEVAAANTLCDQISVLGTQIGATAPIKQPIDLDQQALQGKRMDWDTLRRKTEDFAVDTLKAVRALKLTKKPSNSTTFEVALRLNTSLFGILFAGLLNIGPPRPFAMKSLVVVGAQGAADEPHDPDVVTQDCSVCSDANCVGNVLKKINDTEYRIHTTHHKTANRTKKVIPAFSITKAVDPLAWGIIHEIFEWGHTAVVEWYDPCAETSLADRRRAFRTLETGRVYNVQSGRENLHSLVVKRLVRELVGAPIEEEALKSINCNTLRHMYVCWYRAQKEKAADDGGNTTSRFTPAEEQGAAIAMGTSTRMWDDVYDDVYRQSLVDKSRNAVQRQFTADSTDSLVSQLKTSDEFLYDCLIQDSVILKLTHRLTK
jgi:hypothetical protein